jgi:hypothetical protein
MIHGAALRFVPARMDLYMERDKTARREDAQREKQGCKNVTDSMELSPS